MVTDEEYQEGLDALSSLISGKVRSDGKNWSHAFDMMQIYLERLNLEDRLSKLSVIHVAGTKGKGSTSAMIERILRTAGYKTGLYTSPHLIDVRERIRINGEPIDKDTFMRHMWRCYRTLEQKADDEAGKPAYFRFLTLLGFEIFLDQNVDVVILEVGLGGRLDATNCIRNPVVCGVTSLGFDHMELLGDTLPLIAREKAGIFKKERPAFTVPQPEDALEVLKEVAAGVSAPLQVTRPITEYTLEDSKSTLTIGLPGEHQKINAALAVQLAAQWEVDSGVAEAKFGKEAVERGRNVLQHGTLPEIYRKGLEAARWPGRGQIIEDPTIILEDTAVSGGGSTDADSSAPSSSRLTFYLDGAHTGESMTACAHWFADTVQSSPSLPQPTSKVVETERVLVFNCMQERDPEMLLAPLHRILAQRGAAPHSVLFVPPDSVYAKLGPADAPPDLQWQYTLRNAWERLNTAANGGNNNTNTIQSKGISSSKPFQTTASLKPPPASISNSLLPPLPGAAAAQDATRGAVLPNLGTTLEWLRKCVRERPSLKLQVLVSGSLYLVGDLLKLLGRTSA